MLWQICESLARAPSLLVLHASGNPGNSLEFKLQMRRRLRVRREEAECRVSLINGLDSEDKNSAPHRGALNLNNRETTLKESLAIRRFTRNFEASMAAVTN